MTTTVTVRACCDSKTEKVEVKTISPGEGDSVTHLEDGEIVDFLAYDDRQILVSEVLK